MSPSAPRSNILPKRFELTFASVSVVSERLRPLRLLSYLEVGIFIALVLIAIRANGRTSSAEVFGIRSFPFIILLGFSGSGIEDGKDGRECGSNRFLM